VSRLLVDVTNHQATGLSPDGGVRQRCHRDRGCAVHLRLRRDGAHRGRGGVLPTRGRGRRRRLGIPRAAPRRLAVVWSGPGFLIGRRRRTSDVRPLVVVHGHRDGNAPGGRTQISRECLARVRAAERAARRHGSEAVLFCGAGAPGHASEAQQMARAWKGLDVRMLLDERSEDTAQNADEAIVWAREIGTTELILVSSWWHVRMLVYYGGRRFRGVTVRHAKDAPLSARRAPPLARAALHAGSSAGPPGRGGRARGACATRRRRARMRGARGRHRRAGPRLRGARATRQPRRHRGDVRDRGAGQDGCPAVRTREQHGIDLSRTAQKWQSSG